MLLALNDMAVRLVIGLGNPGREYANTRHNVGFDILDELASDLGVPFEKNAKLEAHIAKAPGSGGLVMAKPQTFMNLSGNAASRVCRFFKITPEEVFVVFDDLDLPLAKLRIRLKGSAGGHNGMKSIIQSLGTDAIPRMKVGIGAPPGATDRATVGHVLGKFRDGERSELEKSIKTAVLAIRHALDHDVQAAMNEYNRREKPAKKQAKPKPKVAIDPSTTQRQQEESP